MPVSERELARLTAEKIDQIESEMISDALAAGVDALEAQALGVAAPVQSARKPTAVELLGRLGDKEVRREHGLEEPEYEPEIASAGALAYEAGASNGLSATQEAPSGNDATPARSGQEARDSLGFSTTMLGEDPLAIQIVDGSMPVALEEAAILFSNGNFQGSLEALQRTMADDNPSGAYRTLCWHMQFDLLRVMGDRETFEQLAIDYANETESSPPTWSDDLKAPESMRKKAASPSHLVLRGTIDGRTSSVVDQLQRAAGHKRECSVDVGEATGIDADGARQLLRLIDVFSKSGWPLRIEGATRLLDLALAQIETGRLDDDDVFWRFALNGLRLLNQEARFDDLSIDFCVTYEVSPPSWEPMPKNVSIGASSSEAAEDDQSLGRVAVQPGSAATPNRITVDGDLTGQASEVVKWVNELTETHDVVMIECPTLRRIDFSAAGALLNLLIQLQGRGKKLIFIQPNYMIYALMLVMGMQELAAIRRRR